MKRRPLLEKILRLFAFDGDLYREAFCRILCRYGLSSGRSLAGSELYLRGLTYRKLSKGKKIYVGRYVVLVGREKIELGEGVSLYGFNFLNAGRDGGYIRIGERSHIDQFSVLYGQGGIEIGRFCAIASGVKIYSQSNQYQQDGAQRIIDQPVIYKKVTIGDDVWIGANAVILPGVRIGEGSIIGANAAVRHDVPSRAIVAGNPAKIIGWRKES